MEVGDDFSIENLHATIERSGNPYAVRVWIFVSDCLVKGLFCAVSFEQAIGLKKCLNHSYIGFAIFRIAENAADKGLKCLVFTHMWHKISSQVVATEVVRISQELTLIEAS